MPKEWRHDRKLRGRFHPEYPDDLRVMVHDGGPRFTDRRPELIWVRATGSNGDVFSGRVLNQPEQLRTVFEGSEILFIVPESREHPLRVTDKYLQERGNWVIDPCNKCGLSELFDVPSDLLKVIFPNSLPDAMDAFTAFGGACGGVQVVCHKNFNPDEEFAG